MGHSCWQVQRPPRTRALLGSENSRPLTFQGVKSRGLVVGEGRSELELPDSRSETELLSHITSHTVQAGFVRACDRLHLSASFLELLGLGEGEAAKGWTARRNGASWNFSHFSVTAVPIFLPSRRFHHTQLSRGSRARTHTHTRTHSLARSLALSALSLSLSSSLAVSRSYSFSLRPSSSRSCARARMYDYCAYYLQSETERGRTRHTDKRATIYHGGELLLLSSHVPCTVPWLDSGLLEPLGTRSNLKLIARATRRTRCSLGSLADISR